MPTDISPRQFQQQVHRGFENLDGFRRSRVMFIRALIGQYYGKASTDVGAEPMNMIFNAVRTIVPHIVMNFPEFNVSSEFLAYRPYGEMLGKALTYDAKRKKLEQTIRRLIVDSLFTMGTLKTGLGDSGTVMTLDSWGESYDPGSIYTELVSFDNLVFDPACTDLREAAFIGDRIRVPRLELLESGLYNNELVEQIPGAESEPSQGRAKNMGKTTGDVREMHEMMDEVEVVELWVPSSNSIVTVPYGGQDYLTDDYLRIHEYYGPDTGPYTFLQFGTPVPDNPLGTVPVGMWYDLHKLANQMAKKTIDQAVRQKDLVLYRRSAADDAQEMLDAADGEAVASDDPDGINKVSFGGQQGTNELMTSQLMGWFNMMANNPQGIGGQQLDADSATEAQILQSNASVGLSDMKDLVYTAVAEEGSKRAWFLHNDPLIKMPMVQREVRPAEWTADGQLIRPQAIEEVQMFLTPEVRRGDWLDFTFEVQPESMGKVDSAVRLQRALDFAIKVMPAVAATAQAFMQVGLPFNAMAYIVRLGKEIGINWLDEVIYDPEFQMQVMSMMMMSPQPGDSKAQPILPGMMQNGQPGNVGSNPSPAKQQRQQQQSTAAEGQRNLPVRARS